MTLERSFTFSSGHHVLYDNLYQSYPGLLLLWAEQLVPCNEPLICNSWYLCHILVPWYRQVPMSKCCDTAEIPTSGDLKSEDFLFFTPPPPRKLNKPRPPPHPWQIWEWLRTLQEVLHEVHTIKICDHRFDARNNLCQWLNRYKMPQKQYYE